MLLNLSSSQAVNSVTLTAQLGVSNGLCEPKIWEHASSAFIFASTPTSTDHFLMRSASTLEITNGEQRALRKFSASWNLSLLKRCFAPSNLADTFKTGR